MASFFPRHKETCSVARLYTARLSLQGSTSSKTVVENITCVPSSDNIQYKGLNICVNVLVLVLALVLSWRRRVSQLIWIKCQQVVT